MRDIIRESSVLPESVSPPRAPSRRGASGGAASTALDLAIRHTTALGPEFAAERDRLAALRDRLAEGRFHLAVLGQFKRGKSTLLNALLGEAVLPTSVVPLTAIPTFVRYASSARARVHYQDGRPPEQFASDRAEDLAAFLARSVTESANPKNRLGVSQVDVFYPAPILARGVVLIDTPGIGSTFRHNTEATLNFLPQCDAALFLLSADPPVTEVEVEFLKQVQGKVARLFFILNKVDYLAQEERQAALRFLQGVLREQAGMESARIFCLSAKAGLDARRSKDPSRWRLSGLAEMEEHLVDFLANGKAAALRAAVNQKARGIVEAILLRIRLTVRSLQMPLEQLQERVRTFREKIAEAGRERVLAADLLAGEARRVHEFLEERSEALRRKATKYLEGAMKEALADPRGQSEDAVRERLAAVIPGFFEHHAGEMTAAMRARVTESLRPHQTRADALIESVRRAAAELFDIPYKAPPSEGAFEMAEEPYWVTHQWNSELYLIPPGLLDRFLPARVREARVVRRLREQIGGLVTRNVENLRWATYQGLDQTFGRFGGSLDERLAATIEATQGAIQAAIEKRREHGEAVAQETARLEAAEASLAQVIEEFGREIAA